MILKKYFSYINSASAIINSYNGTEPFHLYIKKYFATQKKFGSGDRKFISNLCYGFFRMGKLFPEKEITEKLVTGYFLNPLPVTAFFDTVAPQLTIHAHNSLPEKLDFLNISGQYPFPFHEAVSADIDFTAFNHSFFIQPDVFLRIRPGYEKAVPEKLQAAGIVHTPVNTHCLRINNATLLPDSIIPEKEIVIQDLSSQQIGESYLQAIQLLKKKDTIKVWDCCAASGGKSILLHDIHPSIDLTVSDIRPNILQNLKQRFKQAGISRYRSFTGDLTKPLPGNLPLYDIIICDVPCSGSGTWSRTPEQLYFFDDKEICRYQQLQKNIITNILPQLKPGGILLYSTCSVFNAENEMQVQYISSQFNLTTISTTLIAGYSHKADSLFSAIFQKPV